MLQYTQRKKIVTKDGTGTVKFPEVAHCIMVRYKNVLVLRRYTNKYLGMKMSVTHSEMVRQ